MPSKRDRLAQALDRGGALQALGALRSACVHDLRVLAYHRVLPTLDEQGYGADLELVSAVEAEFDWQMAYVASRFRPVDAQQVAVALDGGPALPRRAVMVTFDDGFRDNHDVAFPVLLRHGVPATFFLATGNLDGQASFWFDWLVQVLLRLRHSRVPLPAADLVIPAATTAAERRAQAAALLTVLKRSADAVRLAVLAQLAQQAAAAGVETSSAATDVLDWDQVRTMSRGGMAFGSHTVTHPILSRVADEAQILHELAHSRQRIVHETGRPVIALAYPVGGVAAVDSRVLTATSAAGYRLAFTYQSGVNRMPAADRWQLKRLHVERYTTRRMFAAALELPGVFAR
jgi:peptidoglycan/xylan/chitin deacetylase (PgdA/CDA1 family)